MGKGAHRREAEVAARSPLGLVVMRLELQILDQEDRSRRMDLAGGIAERQLTGGLTAVVMCSVLASGRRKGVGKRKTTRGFNPFYRQRPGGVACKRLRRAVRSTASAWCGDIISLACGAWRRHEGAILVTERQTCSRFECTGCHWRMGRPVSQFKFEFPKLQELANCKIYSNLYPKFVKLFKVLY
jgi:hypothetical protein